MPFRPRFPRSALSPAASLAAVLGPVLALVPLPGAEASALLGKLLGARQAECAIESVEVQLAREEKRARSLELQKELETPIETFGQGNDYDARLSLLPPELARRMPAKLAEKGDPAAHARAALALQKWLETQGVPTNIIKLPEGHFYIEVDADALALLPREKRNEALRGKHWTLRLAVTARRMPLRPSVGFSTQHLAQGGASWSSDRRRLKLSWTSLRNPRVFSTTEAHEWKHFLSHLQLEIERAGFSEAPGAKDASSVFRPGKRVLLTEAGEPVEARIESVGADGTVVLRLLEEPEGTTGIQLDGEAKALTLDELRARRSEGTLHIAEVVKLYVSPNSGGRLTPSYREQHVIEEGSNNHFQALLGLKRAERRIGLLERSTPLQPKHRELLKAIDDELRAADIRIRRARDFFDVDLPLLRAGVEQARAERLPPVTWESYKGDHRVATPWGDIHFFAKQVWQAEGVPSADATRSFLESQVRALERLQADIPDLQARSAELKERAAMQRRRLTGVLGSQR
jgi:hypothetical protein